MAVFYDTRILPKTREELENLIEDLVAHLDALDGCPDLEDGGDQEPWISAQETGPGGEGYWKCEWPGDREWDPADAEPWLGSVERGPEGSQISWSLTGDDHREDEVRRPVAPHPRTRNGTHSLALHIIDGEGAANARSRSSARRRQQA